MKKLIIAFGCLVLVNGFLSARGQSEKKTAGEVLPVIEKEQAETAREDTATYRLVVYGNANNDDYIDQQDLRFIEGIA